MRTCSPTSASSRRRPRSRRCASRAPSTRAAPFRRLATAVAKYWVCKATPPLVAEALECLGGNGYVEESGLPRLYRESPLNSIWEGAGNVIALDVLRAIEREPESLEAFLAELEPEPRATGRAAALAESRTSPARGGSSRRSRSRSRRRSSSGTRRPRSRTRSSRPGSAATAAAPMGRCRRASRSTRSSSGTGPGSDLSAGRRIRAGPIRVGDRRHRATRRIDAPRSIDTDSVPCPAADRAHARAELRPAPDPPRAPRLRPAPRASART